MLVREASLLVDSGRYGTIIIRVEADEGLWARGKASVHVR